MLVVLKQGQDEWTGRGLAIVGQKVYFFLKEGILNQGAKGQRVLGSGWVRNQSGNGLYFMR